MNDADTCEKIRTTISQFWEKEIKPRWDQKDCEYPMCYFVVCITTDALCLPFLSDIFDILLTRNLQRGHLIDFNPYAPYTDALLFDYEELQQLANQDSSSASSLSLPILRVIDSASHPVAARNAPANQHNMVPLELLSLSSGRTVEEFVEAFQQEVLKSSSTSQSGT